jgi:aspartate-semialdehyde dehydrogenase
MSTKTPVGILGATGMVGQRFVQMLEHHPWFEVAWLAASDRSEGRLYGEAARWKMKTPLPARVAEMRLSPARSEGAPKIIFAALDASIAAEMEPRFAAAGCAVVTNSSALRMQRDVPLVIPEVNPDHIQMIECQSWRKSSGGFVVTNPNCSAIGLVMALKPVQDLFGLETVMAVTMQAVSGAGYPGVASLDILGNVVPFISGEEEKMETEPQKLLGKWDGSRFIDAGLGISAHCNRVPVRDGHLECVSLGLKKIVSIREVAEVLRDFAVDDELASLPTAMRNPIVVVDEENRPQPRRDAGAGHGMAAVVGRIRECSLLDVKLALLSHNLVRGAAGAAVLNAELLAVRGFLHHRDAAKLNVAESVAR